MPGSWELRESNSVLVGILHTETTTIPWSFGLRSLIVPGREDLRQFFPFVPLAGMPFDMARNMASMRCLELGAEWLFFLDSDVVCPKDTIPRLIARKKHVVSGMYCRRSPPWSVPVAIKDGQWLANFRPGSLVEVDVTGAGCLLVHRSVLERLKPQRPQAGKHWFDWRVDCKGLLPDGECLSEDFTFNVAVKRQLGIPTFLDTSVRCKHLGLSEADLASYRPAEAVYFN